MAAKLPTKLNKEPLIDAIFEVRFSGKAPASAILPGLLFSALDGDKVVSNLPVSQLPKPVRDADPNLKFAPLSRVEWSDYFVNVGDNSLSVSCKYPYPGWKSFKLAINKVINIFAGSGVVELVDRYSMKYVDLIAGVDNRARVRLINFNLTVAGHMLESEPYQFRVDIPRGGHVNIIQVISNANVVLHSGKALEGMIVDVDSISNQEGVSIENFLHGLDEKLENIHSVNKEIFFDCLTDEAIHSLEPVYE